MKLKEAIKNYIRFFKKKVYIPIPSLIEITRLLQGKNVLIVGGTGNVGQACALKCIQSGANVVITGSTEKTVNEAIDTIISIDKLSEERVNGVVLNLKYVSTFPEIMKEIVDIVPRNQIDILINCAGLLGPSSFWETSEESYDSIMDVNVKGVFFITQEVAKHMISNRICGHILNISSSSSMRPAKTPYCVSKWAVRGFTVGMAEELIKYGIVVNAIAPGPIKSAMLGMEDEKSIYHETNPAGRYSTPEEVANLAVIMISDLGNMIVGDSVYISGGSGIVSLSK